MGKLIHKNKVVLDNMKVASSIFELGFGLMFASKKKIDKGILLKLSPIDSRYKCATTMFFVFSKLEIIYVNSKNIVVDKVVLNPFKSTYIPKKPAISIIESSVGKFRNIKVGDTVEIRS